MGSFYMNCSVTRHPFCHEQEDAILIPMFVTGDREKRVYMHDYCTIFPLYVKGKYEDCGEFSIEESPMSDRVLSLLKSVIVDNHLSNRVKDDDEEEDDEIDLNDFTWETFFKLSHENKKCAYGRITYVAIHQKVFDRIISDHQLYGQLDESVKDYQPDNYGHYGFEHFISQKRNKVELKKVEVALLNKDYDDRIEKLKQKELAAHIAAGADEATFKPSTDVIMLMCRKEMKVNDTLNDRNYEDRSFLQAHKIDPETPSLGDDEFLNAQQVNFLGIFLACINMPWAESVYSGQECDTDGYKVLRNCYADLTVQATIDNFESGYANEGDVAIDKNDEKLMTLMDKLKQLEIDIKDD